MTTVVATKTTARHSPWRSGRPRRLVSTMEGRRQVNTATPRAGRSRTPLCPPTPPPPRRSHRCLRLLGGCGPTFRTKAPCRTKSEPENNAQGHSHMPPHTLANSSSFSLLLLHRVLSRFAIARSLSAVCFLLKTLTKMYTPSGTPATMGARSDDS